jgi:dihydrolipoamide dehydrogenase
MTHFDLVVLGAGPAGFAAAMRARDLGKRVLVVERDRPGGAGLHHGALSSKTLWELAKDYATACSTDRGFVARDVQLSYPEVCRAVAEAVGERREQLEHQLGTLAPGLEVARGHGRFVDPHTVEVTGSDGVSARYTSDFFLIATGSRPRRLPGIEVDGRRVLTSDHLEDLPDFPRELVILGAGVVGCEYATVFARFGKTRVHLLDRAPRILPFEDEDVSAFVTDSFRRLGVTVHGDTRLDRVRVVEDGVVCTLIGPEGPYDLEGSHLLLSIGRVPNTDEIGLDVAGVQVDKGGAIVATDTQTTAPHIYAAGDVTADVALVNVAEIEARHAVERMFGASPCELRYDALSSILFLAPEVATVGLGEQLARQRGVPYRVAVVDNALVPRNIAMRATRGFVKLLASPDGRLLGLRVVGPQASSAIQGVALLIDRGAHLEDLERCFHPHPAVPEGVQECARLLLGRSVLRPEAHPGRLRVGSG